MKRKTSGFTLVELLILLGIASLLIGIIAPGVATLRDRMKLTQCQANLRQIHTALTSYAGLNRQKFPPNITNAATGNYWFDSERAGGGLGTAGRSWPGKPGGGALECPSDEEGRRSYSMNAWASSALPSTTVSAPANGKTWSLRVAHPDRLILAAESWSYQGVAVARLFRTGDHWSERAYRGPAVWGWWRAGSAAIRGSMELCELGAAFRSASAWRRRERAVDRPDQSGVRRWPHRALLQFRLGRSADLPGETELLMVPGRTAMNADRRGSS